MLFLTSRSYRPKVSRLLSASMYTRMVHLVGPAAARPALVKASNATKAAKRGGLGVLQTHADVVIVFLKAATAAALSKVLSTSCSVSQCHRHAACGGLAIKPVAEANRCRNEGKRCLNGLDSCCHRLSRLCCVGVCSYSQ